MITTVDDHIKNNTIKKIYILHGSEEYLKRVYKNHLIKATVAEGDTMNFTTIEGPCDNSDEIISMANTMPFFAERRVVLVENSKLFMHPDEKLADCIKSLSDSILLIFIEEKVNNNLATVKAAASVGAVINYEPLQGKELDAWVVGFVRRSQKQITKNAVDEIYDRTPSDLNMLEKELTKLIDYCWDKNSITQDDVREVVTKQSDAKIFDLISAIASKDPVKVMKCYQEIITSKTDTPISIINKIANQFRQMLWVKSLGEQGLSNEAIAKSAGLKSDRQVYAIKKVASNFSEDRIIYILGDIAKYDEAIKCGAISDRVAVEMMMMEYSK